MKIHKLGDIISETAFKARILNMLPKFFDSLVAACNLGANLPLKELMDGLAGEDACLSQNHEIRRDWAKGFADKNSYDRTELYAPVARLGDVRFLLTVANKFDLEIKQLDVKTAFLNGTLEKTVYMEVPEGLKAKMTDKSEVESNFERKYVCALQRALYGLKVSPKRWFIRFREAMSRMEFESYPFQPCLFIWRKEEKFALLLL